MSTGLPFAPRGFRFQSRPIAHVARLNASRVNEVVHRLTPQDAVAVAAIHAASWRSAYRGILRDEFLDGDLMSNRTALWEKRLNPIPSDHFGCLAISTGKACGFAFAFGAHDPTWGTQIENLHVLPELKSHGVGRQLLNALSQHAEEAHPDVGLYLWVYEQNQAARRFYEKLGGRPVERVLVEPPGGGQAAELRYVWSSPGRLLHALHGHAQPPGSSGPAAVDMTSSRFRTDVPLFR